MAIGNSKTRRVLRLSRREYRALAEETKAAGMALNLSTFRIMGCWGAYSPWALPVCKDVSKPDPGYHEHSLITLAASVDAERFRAAGATRPEVDWSVLDDSEIYPFIIQHEIGHRQHNFDVWRLQFDVKDLEIREKCRRVIGGTNEVLADRYAWDRIRPGQPLPLGDQGKKLQEQVAEALAYLGQHCPMNTTCKDEWKLTPGQYCDVPDYMLATPERAAFIGPKVHPQILEKEVKYYSGLRERDGYRMYLDEKRPGAFW